MAGEVTGEDLERKNSGFLSQLPFPLGSAIVPRRIYFESHSSETAFIMQPALLGTVLLERKGLWCPTTPALYCMLLCTLVLEKMRWKRMTVGEQRNSLGEQEGFSLPGSRTGKIGKTNSLQVTMVFLTEVEANSKADISASFPLIGYLEVAPVQAPASSSFLPDHSPPSFSISHARCLSVVLCFLSKLSTEQQMLRTG